MKKILSAVLAVCMLVSACLVLTACDEVSARKVRKDPAGTISEAFENALSQFFGDDAGAQKTLEKALKKGSVDIKLASDVLMGGELTEINEILYLDEKNNAFVSDTKLVYGGHRYKATLWGDKEGLTVKSASVLGSDDSLNLNFDSFIKYFPESPFFDALHEMLGLPDDDAETVVKAVEALRDAMNGKAPLLSDEDAKRLPEIFNQRVESAKIEDESGKKFNAVIVSYRVDNEKISEAYDLIMDVFGESESEEDTEKPTLGYDVKADVFITINAKTNAVSTVKVRADVTPPVNPITLESETVMTELLLTFDEKQISLTGKVKAGGKLYTLDAGIEKKQSGNKITYDAHASFKTGNVRMDVLEVSCVYNRKSSELTLQGSVALDEHNSVDVTVTATYTASKSEVAFDLGTVKVAAAGETLFAFEEEDELRISVKPLDEIPAPDADAIDVVTMDEDDLNDLLTGFFESDVGVLISQMLFGTMM